MNDNLKLTNYRSSNIQTHQNTNGIQRPQNGLINVDQNSTRISQTRPKSS